MSNERITLPGVPDEVNDTLGRLQESLAECEPTNTLRVTYYDAQNAVTQVGSIIPPRYYQLGIALGWSAKAVDVLARRCNLDRFVWPDGDLDSLGMRELWDANFLRTEVSSAGISSLIHGPAYLINTKGDESAGEPKSLIHVKDALNATGTWNARRRRLDDLLSVTGRDDEGRVSSLALYLDGETYIGVRDTNGRWQVDKTEHPWGVPAEPMVYKPRTGRPLGQSRISPQVMAAHNQALRALIRMEAHADIYAIPDLWLFGADETIFKNADGTQKAAWQVVMGRIKGVPDDEDAEQPRADAKQFPAASPQPHIDYFKVIAGVFAGEVDIPVTALGVQAEVNTSTADGSDNAERHLIAEAEGTTDDWSTPLRRSIMRALAIQNDYDAIPPAWASIESKWHSPLYLSRAAAADAGAKQLATAPWLAETEVGLELLGLDEQQIRRALAERTRSGSLSRLDALARVAAAGEVTPVGVGD